MSVEKTKLENIFEIRFHEINVKLSNDLSIGGFYSGSFYNISDRVTLSIPFIRCKSLLAILML